MGIFCVLSSSMTQASTMVPDQVLAKSPVNHQLFAPITSTEFNHDEQSKAIAHANLTQPLLSADHDRATLNKSEHSLASRLFSNTPGFQLVATALTPVKYLWGKPAKDSIVIGMQSYHMNRTANYNETHNIVGLQYKGITYSSFKNSHNQRTELIALSRNIIEHELFEGFDIEVGYKAGLINAYRNKLPRVSGEWSLGAVPIIGMSYKNWGVDFWTMPFIDGGFVAMNFRVNLTDKWTWKI